VTLDGPKLLSSLQILSQMHSPGKNWMAWTFCSAWDSQKIHSSSWSFRDQTLFLKNWTMDFDATSEKVEFVFVWVRLSGLPLPFCSDEVFREIGNSMSLTMMQIIPSPPQVTWA